MNGKPQFTPTESTEQHDARHAAHVGPFQHHQGVVPSPVKRKRASAATSGRVVSALFTSEKSGDAEPFASTPKPTALSSSLSFSAMDQTSVGLTPFSDDDSRPAHRAIENVPLRDFNHNFASQLSVGRASSCEDDQFLRTDGDESADGFYLSDEGYSHEGVAVEAAGEAISREVTTTPANSTSGTHSQPPPPPPAASSPSHAAAPPRRRSGCRFSLPNTPLEEPHLNMVTIHAPLVNTFLGSSSASADSSHPRAQHAWISPSRYSLEFEEDFRIGEGQFSHVYCATHRLDGVRYAIKKLFQKFPVATHGLTSKVNSGSSSSDSYPGHAATTTHHPPLPAQAKKIAMEIHALAALQGCPHIVQYYGSWMDEDGRVFIQTEYCSLGSLEVFVSSPVRSRQAPPPSASSFAARSLAARGRSHSVQAQSASTQASQDTYMALSTPRNAPSGFFGPPSDSFDPDDDDDDDDGAGGIPEPVAWTILHRIASALQFMHNRGIAHMDLRPANILLTHADGPFHHSLPAASGGGGASAGASAGPGAGMSIMLPPLEHVTPRSKVVKTATDILEGRTLLKLADFGQALRLDCRWADVEEGETRYVAREVITSMTRPNLARADMFSLGACVYELCLGRPLGTESEEWQSIRDGHLDVAFTGNSMFSESLIKFVSKLLCDDPESRPSPQETIYTSSAALQDADQSQSHSQSYSHGHRHGHGTGQGLFSQSSP